MLHALVHDIGADSSFSLPMTIYGCPDVLVQTWTTGYMDVQMSTTGLTDGGHLHGVKDNGDVRLRFCTIQNQVELQMTENIGGSFCVLQSGNECPWGKDENHKHLLSIIAINHLFGMTTSKTLLVCHWLRPFYSDNHKTCL